MHCKGCLNPSIAPPNTNVEMFTPFSLNYLSKHTLQDGKISTRHMLFVFLFIFPSSQLHRVRMHVRMAERACTLVMTIRVHVQLSGQEQIA